VDGTLTRLRGGSGGEGAATYAASAASRDLEVVEGTEVAPGNRLLAGD
jgi:hypothetical protein